MPSTTEQPQIGATPFQLRMRGVLEELLDLRPHPLTTLPTQRELALETLIDALLGALEEGVS